MWKNILLVGIGGGLGSMGRYLLQKWIGGLVSHPFPIGTFLVNISGSLLIGIFYGLALKGSLPGQDWKLFLTTGICGGFTTFSAFALENVQLLKTGNFLIAGLYIGASVLLGIAAVFGGMALCR